MRKLLAVLAVLGGVGVIGELAAPSVVEGRIEAAARERVREAATVEADVRSFPLVTRLLLTATVRSVELEMTDVVWEGVRFASVGWDMRGVEVDRAKLASRELKVTAVDEGTMTAVVDVPGLRTTGRVQAQVDQGVLTVRILGRQVLRMTVPRELMPCDPDVRSEPRGLVLSCTFRDVPPELLEGLQA